MTEDTSGLKQDMEEKLMEAKVFLSEARYTNINVDNIKNKIRKAVDMREQENFEGSIELSEEAIELAETILDLYDGLKRAKKKIIGLKEDGYDYKDILDRLVAVKDLSDEGEYKKADKKLKELSVDIEERIDNIEEQDNNDLEIEKEMISMIPENGITVYSLNKKLDDLDKDELNKVINSLKERGYVEMDQKGRWEKIYLTDKEYNGEEKTGEAEPEEKTSEVEYENPNDKSTSEKKIEIDLTEDEYRYLNQIWENIFLSHLDENIVESLDWGDRSTFLKDIFFFGLDNLRKDPLKPIENKILSEMKLLKSEYDDEILKRDLEEKLDKLVER
ncbi:MAG: hypothetical protein R6W73_03160 [Candidatus Saliniplasma sp.]